ncbi:glutathione S-transferase [Emericellopsis atlantica]|uniref:Glutathione S-transferase n=1 Tax=Emericellopsis atlantica TaxID=2614577 RepID=A0A9P8CN06_9HYPO|nr:glutathione S-transferase [Emericellopsis atlantica]KAG9252988.1 glutathione S-transferase [Emericellopsis atlantica]
MSATGKLIVFRGGPATNTYVWSPFVTKLEARLRFAAFSYNRDAGSPRSAPKGKIPYVQFPDATTLGDSTLIIKHLVDRDALPDLNAPLKPAQRAQDLAIRALLEDKLYFYHGKEKWCDNYTTMRDGVLAAIPWPMRMIIGYIAQRGAVQMLYGQGTLRLQDDEITMLMAEIWDSVEALLQEAKASRKGEKGPFWVLGGKEPTEADATLFGFVAGALVCDA